MLGCALSALYTHTEPGARCVRYLSLTGCEADTFISILSSKEGRCSSERSGSSPKAIQHVGGSPLQSAGQIWSGPETGLV